MHVIPIDFQKSVVVRNVGSPWAVDTIQYEDLKGLSIMVNGSSGLCSK